MNNPFQKLSSTKIDTISGTVFAVLFCANIQEIIKTATLALVGAIVSFSASVILRKLDKWFKQW